MMNYIGYVEFLEDGKKRRKKIEEEGGAGGEGLM